MTNQQWEDTKDDAVGRFIDTSPDRLNCAQAVVHFALKLTQGDPDLVLAGRYFGGGISRAGETCGAVNGIPLALGLRDYTLGKEASAAPVVAEKVQEILRDFRERFGAVRCRELTGHDIRTLEDYKEFRAGEDFERCPQYISWICDQLAPLLTNR